MDDHPSPTGLTPLAGGWSGETFLADTGEAPVVVRIYGGRSAARGPAAPEIDAALHRLVRGLVPVPDVLEVRRSDPTVDAPGLLVTRMMPGERGDLVLPTLDEAALEILGSRVGRLAATLAGIATAKAGLFTDADLRIEPWPPAADGLPGWIDAHAEPLHAHGWSGEDLTGLQAVGERAQDLLDEVGRTCLVHSDLNPKNWLVDPDTLELTALLDWEFAHSGHPHTDLGNAVRFERDPVWVGAVVAAYVDRLGGDPGDPAATLDRARAADLWALVDLAARREESPVARDAERLLRAIASTGDLHAVPGDR